MSDEQHVHYHTPMEHEPGDEARLGRIKEEFRAGFDFLSSFEHDRVLTVFGSSRIGEDHPVYQEARKFGQIAAQEGFTIVTGGGPGIMEAANRGAWDVGGRSAGLCIELPDKSEEANPYMQEHISFYYLFVRKVMLAHVAQGYIYFPGGFGTMDEFFEISTLVATHKLHREVPVVLVELDYWKPLKEWLDKMFTEKFHTLYDRELEIWDLVDTAEDALDLVRDLPHRAPRHESI